MKPLTVEEIDALLTELEVSFPWEDTGGIDITETTRNVFRMARALAMLEARRWITGGGDGIYYVWGDRCGNGPTLLDAIESAEKAAKEDGR